MFLIFFLLSIHVFVSFYLQSDRYIENKQSEVLSFKTVFKSYLFRHTLIYLGFSCLIFLIYMPNQWYDIAIFMLIGLGHGVIDLCVIKLYHKLKDSKLPYLFLVEQILHLVLLALLGLYVVFYFSLTVLGDLFLTNELFSIILKYLLAFLLIARTRNVIYKTFLGHYSPLKDQVEDIISTFESVLYMISIIIGWYLMIGFIMVIKFIVKFKSLDNKKSAQHDLIRTLFNVLYVIITYYVLFVILENI